MKGAMSWPFLRLYILTLMFFSANAILNVFIPLRGHDLGATNTVIGIVMGAYMLTAMLFRPWAGQIIARIMQGVCTAFFSMSLQLGIIDALPEKYRSEGVSLYSLFSTIPNLLGPLIAVGIWHVENMSIFAIVMIFIAVTTTLFGYRTTFANTQKEVSPKDEVLPFNAMTVYVQFFKNKALFCSGMIMILSSIVFGAMSTFIPLYTVREGFANAGIFLTIQAITVVIARFYLRKYVPSDGLWHHLFMMIVLTLLMVASVIVAFGPHIVSIFVYISAIFIGITQALVYPTLTTYLSFVLPKIGRNMLLGLFIACADLGISLGGVLMGPISDTVGFKWMYILCALLVTIAMTLSKIRQRQSVSKAS